MMDEAIVEIIERALKVGEKHAVSIEKSGFLSPPPPASDLAKDIIQALQDAGYSISSDG